MTEFDRRSALGVVGLGLVATAAGSARASDEAMPTPTPTPAFAGRHQPMPLKFHPAELTGLSEALIRSHYENNYIGAVRSLNAIEGRLAEALAEKTFPPVVYGGLKREELHRTGSVILHELYFGALGGNGAPTGDVSVALASTFGSFKAWESEFRLTAMALAGGSGWCVLAFNMHTARLHNYWAWDHMHQCAASVPLLALDMYEHAFHMDYGAAAAKYIDAFMANVDWREIDRRYSIVLGVSR